MSNPELFIVGCPRSGTTLLRRIVSAHQKIVITPEAQWIPSIYEGCKGLTQDGLVTPAVVSELVDNPKFANFRVSRQDLTSLAREYSQRPYASFVTAMFDLYGKMHEKDQVGNKTPDSVRKIETLHSLWPHARFIHLIRDGRDVALSMINWPNVSRKKPGTFKTWERDRITTAALWWELNVRSGRDHAKSLGRNLYYEMRYESLVANPELECTRLCDFLSLPFDKSMLRHHEQVAVDNMQQPHTRDRQPITKGMRNWRTQMTPADIERFEAAAGDTLADLGYERAFSDLSSASLEHADSIRSALERKFAVLH